MKLLVLFLIISGACVAASSEDDGDHLFLNQSFLTESDGNSQEADLGANEALQRGFISNSYILFTRKNQKSGQILHMNNVNSIRNSYFDSNDTTVVIVHGWFENRYSDVNPAIRDAYLEKSDVNVIVVDWSHFAMRDYVTATASVPVVGVGLGKFMNFLHEVTGAPYDTMHLVGFSLGAHVVGNAGRTMGRRAARITGLDPAGPMWTLNINRLRATDAVYVEAIHTDGGNKPGNLGIGIAVAQTDFFPNGGSNQPGCISNLCNHYRAWQLFAATVTYNHLVGYQCANNLQLTLNNCHGASLNMGNDMLNKTGRGKFRLDTGSRYPY